MAQEEAEAKSKGDGRPMKGFREIEHRTNRADAGRSFEDARSKVLCSPEEETGDGASKQ